MTNIGIVFGPFTPVSEQGHSFPSMNSFLSFQDYQGVNLLEQEFVVTRIRQIGSEIGEPIERYLDHVPLQSIKQSFEYFQYALFVATADYLRHQFKPEKTIYGQISTGLFPCLVASRTLNAKASFIELRSLYRRYFRRAARDMRFNATAGFILETEATHYDQLCQALAKKEFRGKVFIRDIRGEYSYLMCGKAGDLAAFKRDPIVLGIRAKCGHNFAVPSSHTPLCSGRVASRNIRAIEFCDRHDEIVMSGSLKSDLKSLELGKLESAIDYAIRGQLTTYEDYKLMASKTDFVVYIGGTQTTKIVKTFSRRISNKDKILTI